MAQVINTNILSLNAQRNLTTSSGALQTSLQRLSSGLRINSAKDDAAGLAISERFSTQIRGINQAVRNANDGISLAQVAEGALGEVSNNLQRIRELAVQARNATNSSDDRIALNAEVQQRIAEIERVADQTEFNGTKLLDGTFAAQVFQVGANQGQTISVNSITDAQTASLGSWTSPSTTQASITVTAANLTAPATNDAGTAGDTTDDFVEYAATTVSVNGTDYNIAGYTSPAFDSSDGGLLTAAQTAARTQRLADMQTALDAIDGVSATIDGGGDLVITSSSDILIANAGNVATAGITDGTVTASTVAGSAETGFAGEDVLTAERADRMMLAMDAALTAVNGARAELGAVQNRFESVVANLSSASENLSASRSRILDADFAAETAQLTRAQILQQAGISVLSQANAAPQSVLSLLR